LANTFSVTYGFVVVTQGCFNPGLTLANAFGVDSGSDVGKLLVP
jgi:hypothetical protein